MKVLLKRGTDITAMEKKQRSALGLAVLEGHMETVAVLLYEVAGTTDYVNEMDHALGFAVIKGWINVFWIGELIVR